jgi:hypothetical protein
MPPKQAAPTGLMAKLGSKLATAHRAHQGDDTKAPGGGSLPEGIEDGVAVLTSIKFGTYETGDNKGEMFFRAAGTIISPTHAPNGRKVEGLQTSIMEPLCDTPKKTRKTFDDHWAWVLNQLRLLGIDTKKIPESQIEAACEALVQAQVQFGFRTWKGDPTPEFPQPRVNETWVGAVQEAHAVGTDDGLVDNTPDASATAQSDEGTAADDTAATSSASQEGGDEDWDAVLARAETGEEAAQVAMVRAALAAGASQSTIDNAPDWAAVRAMIVTAEASSDAGNAESGDWTALAKAADEEGDQDAADKLSEKAAELGLDPNEYPTWAALAEAFPSDEGAAVYVPKKGDALLYAPMDPKTKKPVKKPIDCEVVAVFEEAQTVNLKNLADGKTVYKSVPWAAIQTPPA